MGKEDQGYAMDGCKPTLRYLFIAALTLQGPWAEVQADDVIRQPSLARAQSEARSQPALPATNAQINTATPNAPIKQPTGRITALSASSIKSIQAKPRGELAAEISQELTVSGPTSSQGQPVALSLEPAPGWQAVGDEMRQHVDQCERLIARGAYLSAMEESKRGIVRLVRVLDLRQNKLTSEPAWAQAQQALREAAEFTTHERIATDVELFTRIIRSHETPALHGANVSDLTPLAAAQHYRAYAEKCLVESSQGHPWFSELYYCMGRALEAQSATSAAKADALLQESLAYYRSAHTIQPGNVTNANQLGYVLLRLDRPVEATKQLAQVVRDPNCPLEAWQNLIEASSRTQDRQTEQWALQNYLALKQRGAVPAAQVGTLVELDPKQFAALSPHTSGPQLQPQHSAPQSASPTQNPATTPASTTRTATAPSTGLFR